MNKPLDEPLIARPAARLGISGTFEFKDKNGNVLSTMDLTGSVPLSDLDLTVEDAQHLISQQGAGNGTDNRK